MSAELDRDKRQRRIREKENHIKKQVRIIKEKKVGLSIYDSPHRLAKIHALNCGNPNCVMCGNPRKFFNEPTIQEKRFEQNYKEIEE